MEMTRMTREYARTCFLNGYLVEVEVLKNPGDTTQWFVLLLNTAGKAYMLETDDGTTVVDDHIGSLLEIVHAIGFRQVMVHL